MTADRLTWQSSLFAGGDVGCDAGYTTLTRRALPPDAWVDHAPGWVRGADTLFDGLLAATPWRQHDRWLYDRQVTEPRLSHRWHLPDEPPPLQVLEDLADVLGRRYGVAFTQIGANLYRDGRDSVAWHGDRVARDLPEATVALVVLGASRPFKLRPRGGGAAVTLRPGHGDLLVMGGSCQRTWDHAVPKVRAAGPRVSVQFRHAYDR